MEVTVVSFEPDPALGGVGGFHWFVDAEKARGYYQETVKAAGGGETVLMWAYHPAASDPQAITEEIDRLWSIGWPPPGVPVIEGTVVP